MCQKCTQLINPWRIRYTQQLFSVFFFKKSKLEETLVFSIKIEFLTIFSFSQLAFVEILALWVLRVKKRWNMTRRLSGHCNPLWGGGNKSGKHQKTKRNVSQATVGQFFPTRQVGLSARHQQHPQKSIFRRRSSQHKEEKAGSDLFGHTEDNLALHPPSLFPHSCVLHTATPPSSLPALPPDPLSLPLHLLLLLLPSLLVLWSEEEEEEETPTRYYLSPAPPRPPTQPPPTCSIFSLSPLQVAWKEKPI